MRVIGKIRLFCKVNWWRTLLFNFKHLPLKQAVHLPVLLYLSGETSGNGSYLIDIPLENIRFGMLKFGVRNENSILSKTGLCIHNDGVFVLKGSGVIGNGSSITIGKDCVLTMGRNFGITGDVAIHCYDKITIGDFFSCSWDVSIDDTDHHQLFDVEENKAKKETCPIIIGDYVWICQKVTVLKGSQLSDWTIVSSNSLVNKAHLTPPLYCPCRIAG